MTESSNTSAPAPNPAVASSSATSTGLFVTFEGIDGSGKSTQLRQAAQALEHAGHTVLVTRNPGGTEFGQALRDILLHARHAVFPVSELLLFVADRAQHMDEVVFPALQQGHVVLCDRHIDSTIAYQGYGRGLDHAMIDQLNAIALQGRPPDLTLLFDGPPEQLAQRVHRRGQADRMEAEAMAFHQRVRDGFLAEARRHPHRITVLDALSPIDSLHRTVMQHLGTRLSP